MADAIVRTIYRKLISHKKLLEWVTAADAERSTRNDVAAFVRFMWPAEALAFFAAALAVVFNPAALARNGRVCRDLEYFAGSCALGQQVATTGAQTYHRQ